MARDASSNPTKQDQKVRARHLRLKVEVDVDGTDRTGVGGVQTVIMLPLSDRQIGIFSGQSGLENAEAFLDEIVKQDAWVFARRPLDLRHLIDAWRHSGVLGTRQQQHETNASVKLKEEDPDRSDSNILSDDKARFGAERLALALALTRTRTLRSPEQSLGEQLQDGILEPSLILSDWNLAERRALLRKGLFDPATYGRVWFHHRSVQEYLAACRLRTLREEGMSVKALVRLLFAEIYEIPVVFPSMREIAAWLALWDIDVRKEMIRREPEALLSLGDPETLDLAARRDLVRAFVDRYREGGWRGLHIPMSEVRRIAHPELGSVIRECWGDGPTNVDVRELLIQLIRLGPVEDCAELVHRVAAGPEEAPDHRILAIQALLSCSREEIVRELADDMMTATSSWPGRVVHGVSQDLFPNVIGVEGLILLMEQTPEPPKWQVGGFEWYSRRIIAAVEVQSEVASSLRDGLADLIWRPRAR